MREQQVRRKTKRKKYNRRKRIIIAYTLRTLVGIVLTGMLLLMICGVMFIYEKWSGKIIFGKTVQANADISSQNDTADSLRGGDAGRTDPLYRKEGYCVVLDAGHGGSDGGTQADDALEKEINLAVVLFMQSLLEESGVEVVLTRETDETLSLDERTEIANSKEADLFVSIHCNFYEDDASVSGLECYYFEGADSGMAYAEKILEKIEAGGKVETRNAKESDFYVLRRTEMPAVLVELGYMSNTRECQLLTEKAYQETLAEELVNGILETLR